MNSVSHKKLVFSLYRNHLRFCIRELKYKPLDLKNINEIVLYDYSRMNLKNRKEKIKNLKQSDLGSDAANTIRYIYKQNMNLKNEKEINQCIDYAFHVIRNPYLFYQFEKSYLEDLYIYY